ncbi:hypothetical protein D9M70_638880 [compost metagenome]
MAAMPAKLTAAPSTMKVTKPHQPQARRRSSPTDTMRKAMQMARKPAAIVGRCVSTHDTGPGIGCVARKPSTASVSS